MRGWGIIKAQEEICQMLNVVFFGNIAFHIYSYTIYSDILHSFLKIWVSLWNHLFFCLKNSYLFSISCSAGQMVTNTLRFSYLKVRSLFHHHYWNIPSSKSAVSHSTYCPLASIDFDEKSVVIQMIVHLYRITFKI